MNISRLIRCALFSVFVLLFSGSSRADIVRIVVDGTINPVSAEYISRAIDRASDQHAQAVFIEMRTPGGLVDSTRGIGSKVFASPVPVVLYLYPTGHPSAAA